jgi:hypothetical protein
MTHKTITSTVASVNIDATSCTRILSVIFDTNNSKFAILSRNLYEMMKNTLLLTVYLAFD